MTMRPTWLKKHGLRVLVYGGLALFAAQQLYSAWSGSRSFNGFDLQNSQLPVAQIHQGGPPRDGIPAIDEPQFVSADQVDYLQADERVLGIVTEDGPRAYPIAILNWHEIVNDHAAKPPLLVSYCPLCGTGMAFRLQQSDDDGFGVSGLLYNSDMLLYDRRSESLWSQIAKRAISGPRVGETLEAVPLQHTQWGDWLARHPDTLVLSRDTGFWRDYTRTPYQGYEQSEGLYFPVSHRDRRRHPKSRVIGLTIEGQARVWPYDELAKANLPLSDSLAGKDVQVHYDRAHGNAWITDAKGKPLAATTGFWFAWMAFHPESSVFAAPR